MNDLDFSREELHPEIERYTLGTCPVDGSEMEWEMDISHRTYFTCPLCGHSREMDE